MKKIEKTIDILEIIFKCTYIFHLIFSFTCLGAGNPVTSIITLLLGGALVIYRIINYKKYINFKGEKLLLSFLISYFLSFVIFYRYGIYDEIKVLIWMSIQFILLYAIDINKSAEKMKKEINYVFITIISNVTIMNLINFILLINNYSSYYTALDGQTYILGIAQWGRLYGIVTDPNYISVLSIVAIVAAIYLFINYKNIITKILLIISIILQFIFIAFAQSRTAIVSAIAGIIVYCIFVFITKFKNQKNIKKIFMLLLKIVICSVIIFIVIKLLILGYNKMISAESSTSALIEIKREETISGDISNRRYDIWYSGYEIFKKVPIIGVGFGHFAQYAIENIPSTYIVNNDFSVFTAFHNTVIDVLASQGIIGIIILILFCSIIIKEIVKFSNLEDENKNIVIILITICATIACSAMFLSHVFYVNTPTTAVFWLVLGYLVYFLRDNKENKENE